MKPRPQHKETHRHACALTVIFAASTLVLVTACKDHGHPPGDGHEHGKGAGAGQPADAGVAPPPETGGGPETGDHDHAVKAGPNGGRILKKVEPHAEFFVTAERKVQITFLDDEDKPVAPGGQVVTATAGERLNPTNLSFETVGSTLLSTAPLPAGNNFPVVLQFVTDPLAPAVLERFNLNLDDCPGCPYAEYACTCAHDE